VRARELRRELPPAEKFLWKALRGNKLGAHFRRQQIISGFIVDFYCQKASLVIELDGSIHELPEQLELEKEREQALIEIGLRIIRFENTDVTTNLPDVPRKIKELL
jgi:very-short-patch-repair endonuclease